MASEFILGEDTKKALEGSFESLTRRVCTAILAESSKLFGADKTPVVIGTYSDHALVLIKESGEVVRVKYETSQKNEIVPIAAAIADLSTLTVEQAAKATARSYVEAFLSGAPSTASEQFKKLASLAENASLPSRPARELEKLENKLTTASWKKTFEENKEEFASQTTKLSCTEWTPKFRKLHDGTTPSSEVSRYEGLVTSDLKYMLEKVENLLANTDSAKQTIESSEKKMSTADSFFSGFLESYSQDLAWLKNVLSETIESSKPIDEKSKIYDVLASELNRYEVAGSFIENKSRDLNKAATEEA